MSSEKSTNVEENTFVGRLYTAFGTRETAEIARRLSLNYQTVDNYIKGRIPKPDFLIKIKAATGVSIDWLLTGQGPHDVNSSMQRGETVVPFQRLSMDEAGQSSIYLGAAERKAISELAIEAGRTFEQEVRDIILEALAAKGLINLKPEPMDLMLIGQVDLRMIPVPLRGYISFGKPLEISEQGELVMVSDRFAASEDGLFVLRVRGDFEEEGILEDDEIICQEFTSIESGQTAVVILDNKEATVKRVYFEEDKVRLVPANRKFPPLVVDAHRVSIYATVLGMQRPK